MTAEDLEVAVDVLQDGESPADAVDWALLVFDVLVSGSCGPPEKGSVSSAFSREYRGSASSADYTGLGYGASGSIAGMLELARAFSLSRAGNAPVAVSDYDRPLF